MEFQKLAFQLAIIAIPGLIWGLMDLHVASKRKPTDVQFAIRVFLFGLVSYLFAYIPFWYFNLPFDWFVQSSQDSEIVLSPWIVTQVATASLTGLILGIFWIFASTKKWMYRFLQWIRATKKYGDEDVWDYTFNSNDKRVTYINYRDFQNEITYSGFVNSYSETEKLRELVLRDVQIHDFGGSLMFQVPLIYISRPAEFMHIEFPATDQEAGGSDGK